MFAYNVCFLPLLIFFEKKKIAFLRLDSGVKIETLHLIIARGALKACLC